MQPNIPPYGSPQFPPPGGFGPPPGAVPPWAMSPMGPSMAITPTGPGGFAAKYVALGSYVVLVLSAIGFTAGAVVRDPAPDEQGTSVAMVVAGVAVLASLLAYAISVMVWIYKSWEFIPAEYRRNASGRAFTPGEAMGMHFVPLYNLYWLFVQNLGYCDALDSVMIQSGRSGRAPKNLALAACVVQVVPYVNYFFGPILWMVYMFVVDGVKKQLVDGNAR